MTQTDVLLVLVAWLAATVCVCLGVARWMRLF
jgi:hypothetical protein